MKYVKAVSIALIALLLMTSNVSAERSIAYSMNPDWKACSTDGIVDSLEFNQCTAYPETGKSFESCDHPPKAIYFARHAEKRFRDINGVNNAPQYILSRTGQKMAEHLAKVFAPVPVKAIYTSDYTRTRQTACPLSLSKGLDRHIVCKLETKSDRFLQGALCKSHADEVVVVIGHVDTVNEMLINLKVVNFLEAPDIKFGELYKVTFQGGKGTLHEPPIPYWNCDASGCNREGALNVNLK